MFPSLNRGTEGGLNLFAYLILILSGLRAIICVCFIFSSFAISFLASGIAVAVRTIVETSGNPESRSSSLFENALRKSQSLKVIVLFSLVVPSSKNWF